jgi:phosphoserine phosphatase
VRCLYVDLDSALTGAGGAVTRDGDGRFTLLGIRALEACHRAGVLVVAMSDRPRALVESDARLLGIDDYVFEGGAGFVLDGEPHQLPEGSGTRVAAVAAHARARGLSRADCVAVGASREDLEVADAVGSMWLVANAHDDPTIAQALPRHPNARVADAAHGPGVYEAVVTTLAEAR